MMPGEGANRSAEEARLDALLQGMNESENVEQLTEEQRLAMEQGVGQVGLENTEEVTAREATIPDIEAADAIADETVSKIADEYAASSIVMDEPGEMTNEQIRRANDEDVIRRLEEVDTELANKVREALGRQGANEIEKVDVEAVVLSPEERAEKITSIGERLKSGWANKGWIKTVTRFMKRAMVTVMAVVGLSTAIPSGVIAEEQAAATDEDTGSRKVDLNAMTVEDFSSATETESEEEAAFDLDALLKEGEVDLGQYDLDQLGDGMYDGFLTEVGGEQAPNGVLNNYAEDYGRYDEKESVNSFGRSLEFAYGSSQKTFAEVFRIARNQPEVLASYGAALPETLEAAGFDESITSIEDFNERQKAVDEAFNGENGARLQRRLLAAVTVVLGHGSYTFYLENDTEQTSYIYHENGEENTTENLTPGMDVRQRVDSKQVDILVTFANGTQRVLDLNLPCGGQVNFTVEGEVRDVVSIDEVQEVSEEVHEADTLEEVHERIGILEDEGHRRKVEEEDEEDNEEEDDEDEEEDDDDDEPEEEEEKPDPKPDPEPEPEPEPEPTPDDEVKPKDPENIQNTVDEGLEDAGLGDENMEQTPSEDMTQDTVTEQPEINENRVSDMTDDELIDYMNGLLGQ